MKIGILGPAGFSGSHTARELLNRGHNVVGFSRSPEKIGEHPNYTPYPLEIETAPVEDLIAAFSDLDVLVNAYNPSPGPGVYKTFVETTRRLLLATKALTATKKSPFYLISIGGTGSLALPNEPYLTAADSKPFWQAARHYYADSEASTSQLEDRLGHGSEAAKAVRRIRSARLAVRAGKATEAEKNVNDDFETSIRESAGPMSELPFAARAAFAMYEYIPSDVLTWSFVSPPAGFRPGPRTGKYDVWIDDLPLVKEAKVPSEDGNEFEGRLLGVSAADLGVAIADEVEGRKLVGKHWSPVSEWEGDEAWASYFKLEG